MIDNRTTELLRKQLEERGLSCQTHYQHVSWRVEQKLYGAVDNLDGTLTVDNLTPEQAIAATLGSEREVELQSALYEVSDKWAQAQIEAEDYARENLLLKAKLDSATLGNGTLTAEQVMAIAGKHQPDYCSDTHVCFDWQAIADELNAELGSGTCEKDQLEAALALSRGMVDMAARREIYKDNRIADLEQLVCDMRNILNLSECEQEDEMMFLNIDERMSEKTCAMCRAYLPCPCGECPYGTCGNTSSQRLHEFVHEEQSACEVFARATKAKVGE